MKCLHLADLHLGKRLNGFSMLEDQAYILRQILDVADEERPQAVLIAGDVYDKPAPSAEAVQLFDIFLRELTARELQVLVLNGNHDSAERLSFGATLMTRSGVHIAPVYDGTLHSVSLSDAAGEVCFYMLPYLKPAQVRRYYENERIESYTDAVRTALAHITIRNDLRTVLLSHQFVTGGVRSDSEDVFVGGAENVDASVFAPFDYVALGHLHRPQWVGRETVRYCGSILKYSFSEKDHVKSVTIVDLPQKGTVQIRTRPLIPLHDLREIRGSYDALTYRPNYIHTATDDYLHVVLTDEQDVPDAMRRLQTIYPNVMQLEYDNTRTRTADDGAQTSPDVTQSPAELFAAFYAKQNGHEMTAQQRSFVLHLLETMEADKG